MMLCYRLNHPTLLVFVNSTNYFDNRHFSCKHAKHFGFSFQDLLLFLLIDFIMLINLYNLMNLIFGGLECWSDKLSTVKVPLWALGNCGGISHFFQIFYKLNNQSVNGETNQQKTAVLVINWLQVINTLSSFSWLYPYFYLSNIFQAGLLLVETSYSVILL